ncbi:hypothetical protein H2201_003227 [Coniosporium apollinis]|uniref:UspA domain-containing protein n=1 Tax=Coniosporium apollinis TaxID=61459 RepID=A0ABQ9NX78_9PEZI|nr:hypothetical protein H2201_003227 [Coniosporium apollinis]
MSLEAALDEERREILALLEGKKTAPRAKSISGPGGRTASPGGTMPVRSMLDVDGPPAGRHASIAGTGVGITSPSGTTTGPRPSVVRSMLDPDVPPPTGRSRTAVSPPPFSATGRKPEDQYNFEMLPSIESHSMPKRVTQGGKKKQKPGAVPAISPEELEKFIKERGGRHHSTASILGKTQKTHSPSSRASARSVSPGGRNLNTNSLNLMADPDKFVTESGKVVDLKNAYRRLSDAALLRSGGSLSTLATRKGSDPTAGESLAPGGGMRLEKDYYGDDDEAAVESSEQEESGSSGDEGSESGKRRGRVRSRSIDEGDQGERKPKSLLAAAEEDRKRQAEIYKVRSLLEPAISVIGPDGERLSKKKTGVHPNSNFDNASGVSTPVDSDTEADISEIKRAQRMALTISPIHSAPEAHRCIRQIIRGEYARMQQEAEAGLRRQRVYLVSTDVSEEAAYALEWTIGTVLRDGDTLLAVNAIEAEQGAGAESSIAIGEGAQAALESETLAKTLSNEQRYDGSTNLPTMSSPLHQSTTPGTGTPPNLTNMDKAERDRWNNADEISKTCVKLLRKTRLQVRVVVEVFHCKSPKHMITEVIDFLEPTLVILGSRGRSALKGVLLGSFSNYLVTKSSVPVMVARKRLRKHSKYKRNTSRLSNVLSYPSNTRLAHAKID